MPLITSPSQLAAGDMLMLDYMSFEVNRDLVR